MRSIVHLALKLKGAHRVSAVTDATRLAGTDLKEGLLGTASCGCRVIVDDGVAKLPDFSSFAGSICTADRCLRVLCVDYGVPLHTASAMLSHAPAVLLGLDNQLGCISVGKTADLVLTDTSYAVQHVITDGVLRV